MSIMANLYQIHMDLVLIIVIRHPQLLNIYPSVYHELTSNQLCPISDKILVDLFVKAINLYKHESEHNTHNLKCKYYDDQADSRTDKIYRSHPILYRF